MKTIEVLEQLLRVTDLCQIKASRKLKKIELKKLYTEGPKGNHAEENNNWVKNCYKFVQDVNGGSLCKQVLNGSIVHSSK